MSRVATILIVFAMVVTAVSVAIVLNVQFGFALSQSVTLGLALLFGMALLHVQMERRRDRIWMEARVAEIAAVAGDVNTEVGRVAARVNRLDQDLGERIRDETEPLAAEVEVIGRLMTQIAETVADLENRTDRRMAEIAAKADTPRLPPAAPPPPVVNDDPDGLTFRSERARDPHPPTRREAARAPEPSRIPSAFEREVEAAIRAERIEVHLQPIVTLPQRKVRYYEVLTRLRGGDGRLIPAEEFLPVAEARRAIQKLDTFQVIRSFQVLKRLTARNREIGMFVNLSPISLADTSFFREFNAFLAQNRALADLVQLEFTQAAAAELGPVEAESLRALADLGYRFSVDNVTDLRADFRGLADLGFRTAKISVDRLLGRVAMPAGDIHPADFSGHMQRQGLSVIVDRIETEAQVIDLLDYEVHLAQGYLFSAPRQVRPEILGQQGGTEPAKAKVAGR